MIGCLCIHGFTGAPYEVEPLVEYLKEQTDWLFSVPTLPGHGDNLSLKGIKYQQWIEYAEEELKKLLANCDQVYVIGFSMGGLIASYLAANYNIDKLVLLSAAAYYINPRQLVLDLKNVLIDTVQGNIAKNELFLRYKRKIIQTPLEATLQFRRLVFFTRPFFQWCMCQHSSPREKVMGLYRPKAPNTFTKTLEQRKNRSRTSNIQNIIFATVRKKKPSFSRCIIF
ncbi:alpha/beta fold hydrolase [Neobacillus sp. PS3-34]|nr:alpha/beta fold hydrolase [Neobacillus sp. PS3-34]WML50198.1 alpha/beta fold hydrolase [Neobacillus sp. PS3-34]